jgi:hypothetical protein
MREGGSSTELGGILDPSEKKAKAFKFFSEGAQLGNNKETIFLARAPVDTFFLGFTWTDVTILLVSKLRHSECDTKGESLS